MGKGEGVGGGECGPCQPCGICGIPLQQACFIWGIVHIVWGCLWCLWILLIFVETNHAALEYLPAGYWVFWVIFVLLGGCWLALGVLLLLTSKTGNVCRLNFYLWGVIAVLAAALILSIAWAGWSHGGGYGFWFTFWVVASWWYPYWCIYAYYIECGGKSWCECDGCK